MRVLLFILFVALLTFAPVAASWACYVRTYVINGRIVTCHVCPTHTVCN